MRARNTFCSTVFSIILLIVSVARAQVSAIENSFEQYQQRNLHEKLFVHTDKSFYLTGEILWLKVYDVDAATNKPLGISKVAYVELLDKANTPVVQAKVALSGGTGSGSVFIPVTVENGNYKLRAYTNWMKNFGPDYFFEKQITVLNPVREAEAPAKTNETYDIQFFPEGGNLLAGVSNRVGFRMVGTDGKGVDLHGAIVNQKNDTVARFRSFKFGIGNFTFTPQAGNAYRAVIKTGAKNIIRSLPDIVTHGYNMICNDNSASLSIRVNSSNPSEQVYLFAYNGKQVESAQASSLDNGTVSFSVNKAVLKSGVTHLLVFNSARQPVCERLYFARPTIRMALNVNADQPSYNTRKKVMVGLAANDQNGKPIASDLSLSVFRVDSLQKGDDTDIQSYLWLTSELKGNIESPAYYFANPTAETDQALDNLLLAQGWSRFDWNAALPGKTPAFKFVPEYNGHLISARITNTQTNTPAQGVVTYLSVPGKRVQMYPALSDSSGHLLFNTRDMYGPGEIVVQTNQQKDSTYHIEVMTPFSEQYNSTVYPALKTDGIPASLLENYSLAMQVQNLYAGMKLRQFYDPQADSSAFYFTPYKTYLLDDFTRFPTMEEVMREYVTEVNIFKPKNHFEIKSIGPQGVIGYSPLVMVDGVPVFNQDRLFAMDPLKVRKLEVVAYKYYYGPTANDGIFSFSTYKGDLGGMELDPKAVVLDYEGLQMQRKFFSPVYETTDAQKSHMPDFRTTLYWAPDAGTNISGKSQLNFYTSDQPGKYMIVVQGIAASGAAGIAYTTFEVKK